MTEWFDPETEVFTSYQHDPAAQTSLGANWVEEVFEDRNGQLWVGTEKGVSIFDLHPTPFWLWHHEPENENSLGAKRIMSIYQDSEGIFWIGNQGSGVDRNEGLWQYSAQLKGQDGVLYFPNRAGVQVFDPADIQPNMEQPPVYLTEFRIDNEIIQPEPDALLSFPIEQTENITLPYEQNDFSLNFAALSYAEPEQNQYAYILEGYHDDWIETDGSRREANFTNLPPGDYTFRVRGSNNDGLWSDQEAVLAITITPPWWQTTWFRLSAILLVVGLFYGGYHWRIRSIGKRNRALETEVIQRTLELKDSEARFKGLAESSFEGIVIHNGQVVLDGNPAALELFGYPLDAFIGKPNVDLITSKSVGTVTQHIAADSEEIYEIEGLRQDGSRFPLELHASVIEYQGEKARVVALRDITLRKQTEATLTKAKEAAEGANQAKSTFLSTMSHELRTPLNGILGYAQILKRDDNLTPRQLNGLNIIERSGTHLLTLINDILDLSHVETGKIELLPIVFRTRPFLDNIIEIIQPRATGKGLYLRLEIGDMPTAVIGDAKRLRQILINLLGNAVKFTQEGDVYLQVQTLKREANAVTLRFDVQDTGAGIAPDELDTLFEPFKRGGNQKEEGVGLGLAIANTLVDLMGGQLQASSELGRGSRFWFDISLPLAHDWDHLDQTGPKIVGIKGVPPLILLVDDDDVNLTALAEMLEVVGCDTITAVSALEALEVTTTRCPDAVITDIRMPSMDGNELIRTLRQNPDCQDIPIIAHMRHELKEYSETLEEKVAERTAELSVEIRRRRQNEAEKERLLVIAQQQSVQLRHLIGQLTQSQEQELLNINKELHNHILTNLDLLNIQLSDLFEKAPISGILMEDLQQALKTIMQTKVDTEQIAKKLPPPCQQ